MRIRESQEQAEAVFGKVEFVEVPGIDGETGFVTEVLTEDQFEQRAAKLEVIQRIRVV